MSPQTEPKKLLRTDFAMTQGVGGRTRRLGPGQLTAVNRLNTHPQHCSKTSPWLRLHKPTRCPHRNLRTQAHTTKTTKRQTLRPQPSCSSAYYPNSRCMETQLCLPVPIGHLANKKSSHQ